MRSLLSQLLRHIRDESVDLGELLDDFVREMDGDLPLKNVKHLVTLVSQTAKQFSHQPLMVVDALDECGEVEHLLNGLLTLRKGGMRLFVTSRPLQIIKDILRGLPSISMDKMSSAVSTDIALHVTRELDSRRRLRDLELSFKTEIHSILRDRADGMFRWVQCQIDTLNRCATKAEVREALDNLPIGLDATYQRILVAIDTVSPEGKLALRALVWLVGALRPLRLVEILNGLAIDLGRRTMDHDAGPMHRGALLDACGSLVTYNEDTDILILSHFSVKEYLTGDLTRLKFPRYHISYQGAHEALARFCICYLTLYLKYVHGSDENTALLRIMRTIDGRSRERSHFSEDSLAVFSMSQELLDYVFTDGFNHLAYLGSTNYVVLSDMMALQLDIQRYPDAWEVVYQISQHHKPPIPLPARKHDFMFYVLIAFSSASLFLAFLRRNHNVLKPQYQTNPLVYAAHFGKARHAEMLLSCGAQVNERGLVVDASRQALPLEIAAGRWHDAVVDLLLSAGSMVPKRLFTPSPYYYNLPVRIIRRLLETDQFVEWAVEPGNELPSPLKILEQRPPLVYEADTISIIRRLVQVGVDLTERDTAQRTVLHFAILGGYQALMVYLLLMGISFSGPDFISILSRIASFERIPMLRLVVKAGVNVHAHVGSDDTTLHLAINLFQDDCLEVVKILVGAGCKPFARNTAGKTPLHLALEKGIISVADYLLSQGTPPSDVLLALVNSRCSTSWRLEALRALVNGGVDIHGITRYEDALLMSLERHQCLETAILPGAECDPSGRDTSGKTLPDPVIGHGSSLLMEYLLSTARRSPPLETLFAILRSNLPTAWKALTIYSLVRKGADVRGLSADGNTLMGAAVLALDERQGLDMAKILVGAGCDPYRRAADGKTPLHIALDRRFRILADYLLSTGRPLPHDALFAILHSALPADRRAQTICSLVRGGADVRGLSADGNTLLYATVLALHERQGVDVAEVLVGAGCDPFWRTADGKTPLHIALDRRFRFLADYLLSTGRPLPPDALFSILRSALPKVWRAQTVCSLVGNGADVRGLSDDGNTLLHTTVLSLDETQALMVAKILVGAGCDPSALNRQGKTVLHFAAKQGSEFISFMKYILSLDPSLPDDILFSVLKSPYQGKVPIIRMLINNGADTRVVAVDGNNLLHVAIASPSSVIKTSSMETIVEILVDGGCDAFALNSRGKTPLQLAVAQGYVSIVECLLSIATLPDLPVDIMTCALSEIPSWVDTLFMLLLLIAKGANIHVRAADGGTLLHVAIKNVPQLQTRPRRPVPLAPPSPLPPSLVSQLKSKRAAALKSDNDADDSQLPRWTNQSHRREVVPAEADDDSILDIIKILVGSGCDPSQCDADGHPPVYFAILGGLVNVVEYLLPRTVPLPWNLKNAMNLAPEDVQGKLRNVFECHKFVLERAAVAGRINFTLPRKLPFL
ncbi:ankyrin [Imleria badia]|nr:ankyrin [Imleria badia]